MLSNFMPIHENSSNNHIINHDKLLKVIFTSYLVTISIDINREIRATQEMQV